MQVMKDEADNPPMLQAIKEALKSEEGFNGGNGHDLVLVQVNWKRSMIVKSARWCCKCNSSTLGASFCHKPCEGRMVTCSPSFWKAVIEVGKEKELLEKARMNSHELQKLVSLIGKLKHRTGHEILKAKVQLAGGRSCIGRVCAVCNRSNLCSVAKFQEECPGEWSSDSIMFWKGVERVGHLSEVLEKIPPTNQDKIAELMEENDAE